MTSLLFSPNVSSFPFTLFTHILQCHHERTSLREVRLTRPLSCLDVAYQNTAVQSGGGSAIIVAACLKNLVVALYTSLIVDF